LTQRCEKTHRAIMNSACLITIVRTRTNRFAGASKIN
jgi:hypothetical protein